MRKIFVAILLGLSLTLVTPAYAADAREIISQEVAAYNGDTEEIDWITQAILYASGIYGVDPLLGTVLKLYTLFKPVYYIIP